MLQINALTITHRKDLRMIIRDFGFVLKPGDKAVLVGEEGNGKSTLLKWIYDPSLIDYYADAEGTRTTQGELLGYLPQELSDEDKNKTVYQYFSELQAFQNANPADYYRISSELGFREEMFYSSQAMSSLSGGERVKLQMAGILLAAPDILLLDEPSNDIDIETLEWLEKLINKFPGGVLYISHDETLIERTANRVILVEQLRRKSVPRVTVANMPFRTFMEEREKSFSKQEQMAYSERREEKKAMERFRRIEQSVEHDQRTISRQDPHGGRLLKKKMKAVKTVLDLSLPYLQSPNGSILAKNINLQIKGPERICIIGPNGVGKTTLIRKIAEELCSRTDLSACYMPQNYEEELPFDLTPVEYLAPSGVKDEITMVRTFLGSMKYTSDEMFHPVRELSGGQKAKLFLLKMSLTEANVLILDEPTRNFSPLSGPEVRGILRQFPGTIISVSHDRKYISEVCNKIYEMTAEGLITSQ